MRYGWLLVAMVGLVAILCLLAFESEGARTPDTISISVDDTTVGVQTTATATLSWHGGGSWDGLVNFTWVNETDNTVFYEEVLPDGSGIALSTYTPGTDGTWHVNGTWTTDPSLYDNKSFTVSPITAGEYDGVIWSDGVLINATFTHNTTWIGQHQSVNIVVMNSTDYSPIAGVEVCIAVTTSVGETIVPQTSIGVTASSGCICYNFEIPVEREFEDTYMILHVITTSTDYTGVYGWLSHYQFSFYCGYYLKFSNESAHPVDSSTYNIYDIVVAEMNYTMNYTNNIEVNIQYSFINASYNLVMYTESVDVVFNPNNILDSMSFSIPPIEYSGGTFIYGFLEINIPDSSESIIIYRYTRVFDVNITTILYYNNLPFPIDPSSIYCGDEFCVLVNRTTLLSTSYSFEFSYLNVDTDTIYERISGSDFSTEGTLLYCRMFTFPLNLPSGTYKIIGISNVATNGTSQAIEFESEEFVVNALKARLTSDLDVFENYTRLALDAGESTGYNDSYWGVYWTSSHAPGKIWRGLQPILTFNTTGTYRIAINITDGLGNYSTDSFLVHVFVSPVYQPRVNTKPEIIAIDLQTSATVGEAYSYDFEYVDVDYPTQDVSFGLSTNATWLTIDPSTGVLNGTAEAGTYSVTVIATDEYGHTDTLSYTLKVSGTSVTEDVDELYTMVLGIIAPLVLLAVLGIMFKMFKPKKIGGKK